MKTLGLLRGIAIIAVVVGHATLNGMTALTYWGHRFGKPSPVADFDWVGTPTYYGLIVTSQLSLFSVPLFVFAAGYYVMYASRGEWSRVTGRIIVGWLKNLAYPFLTWMIVSTGVYALTVVLSPSGRQWELGSFIFQRAQIYFFAIALAELFVLSPLLMWLAQKHPAWLLTSTAALMCVDGGLTYLGLLYWPVMEFYWGPWSGWGWLFIQRFAFFFSLGLVLSKYGELARKRLASLRRVLLVVVVISGLLTVLEVEWLQRVNPLLPNENYTTGLYVNKVSSLVYFTAAVLTLYSVNWRLGKAMNLLTRIGIGSYGIYLAHLIALDFVTKLVYHVAPQLFLRQLLFQPLLVLAGVGIPMVVMGAAWRSPLRRYHRYLFGS